MPTAYGRWCILILVLIYGFIFYLQTTYQLILDFPSFYSSSTALKEGINPYQSFHPGYLPKIKKLSVNLNPPVFLQAIQWITQFSYRYALTIWLCLSAFASWAGAYLCIKLVFDEKAIRQYWPWFILMYGLLFSTIMNTAIAQVGSFIFFFLMAGYYFYTQNKNIYAGILWGVITAFKLFPGLVLLFALKQKRYSVCFAMTATIAVLFMIPLVSHGPSIYGTYANMLSAVLWYGDSWNASIYGYLFRIFINPNAANTTHIIWLKGCYFVTFLLVLTWFYRKVASSNSSESHASFALTLVVMLLLSPLGWLYYFSMLFFPLLLTGQFVFSNSDKRIKPVIIWLVGFYLVNCPLDYIRATKMDFLYNKLWFFSFYFYGLLVLAYLVLMLPDTKQILTQRTVNQSKVFMLPVLAILVIGFLVPISYYVAQFLS